MPLWVILQNARAASSGSVRLALRDTAGNLRVTDTFRLRGGASTGFRAPTPGQVISGNGSSLAVTSDT